MIGVLLWKDTASGDGKDEASCTVRADSVGCGNANAACAQYSFTMPGETVPQTRSFIATRTRVTNTVNGQTSTTMLPLDYFNGQTVVVWYDPTDPVGTASLTNDDWRVFGGILLGIGVAIIIIAWVHFWATNRFKAFAALEGGSTALNLFTGAFGHH